MAASRSLGEGVALMVLSILALVGGMVFFYYYPWPSGERPTLGQFVAFWFRELLILGVVVVALAAVAVSRITRATRGNTKGERHAP